LQYARHISTLPIVRGVCLVLALFAARYIAPAQQPSRSFPPIDNERLLPIRDGYLGVSFIDGFTGLRLYARSMNAGTQTYIRDVVPVDMAYRPQLFAADSALLLSTRQSTTNLYTVGLKGTPEPALFWSGHLPGPRRIAVVQQGDGETAGYIVLIGDSGLVVVGTDRRQRFAQPGTIVDAVVDASEPSRLIVAARAESGVRLTLLDASAGQPLESYLIPWTRDIEMRSTDLYGSEQLVVVTRDAPYRAFFFDPRTLLPTEPLPLPSAPERLVPVFESGTSALAALTRTYPSPTFVPLGTESGAEAQELEYPLGEVFDEAVAAEGFVTLIGRDSIAVYDSTMTLVGTAASGGIHDADLFVVDREHLLLSSFDGSRWVEITPGGRGWLARHWLTALLIAAAIALLVLLVAAFRRYRFVRNIYNNLVRVPSSNGVIIMSASRRVKHLNASARGLLGIAPYIPLGRYINDYLNGEEYRPVLNELRGLFADGDPFVMKIDVDRDGDIRAYSFRGRPMFGTSGVPMGYLLLVEDVTQTIERERLVNWASVAHHIAHEMKTPLGTVSITAETLYDQLNSNGADRDLLRSTSRIVRQSERLREIVEDLLTIARTESLKKVRADLCLALSSLAHDCADFIPATIELKLQLPAEPLHSMVDISQLTVAIRNIIDNAWQAIGSRDGGCICLSVEAVDAHVVISIQDNGIGMSRETMTKLFQPFYTEREGGSGIGTVIIKRVIEAHGGTIQVDSEIGVGTTFTLRLPRN